LPGLRLATRPNLPISLAAAAASALLSWLSLPPADLGPIAFVALVPILWAMRRVRVRRAALLGLVTGVTFYGVLLSWLIPLTVLGWAALAISQGAWFVLTFTYVAVVWRDESPVRTALLVGAGAAAIEWLRTVLPFGGWSWVNLGYSQHDNALTLPLASWIGALGLFFVVVTVNCLVLAAILRVGEWRRAALPLALAAVLVVGPGLIPEARPDGSPVDVAAIQGNVPYDIAVRSRIIEDQIVARNHAELHRGLAADPPDLAVWPENALDRDPTRDQEIGTLVGESVREVGAWTLVGAITETDDGLLLNEDLLYGPDGQLRDRYAKNHLLPFGEFVPFRGLLDWIPDVQRVRSDLSPGDEPGSFELPGVGFAAAICFENAFPDLIRDYVTENTGFVVISTNNSTFGRSPAPDQHLVLSELRAVETGRWVVHAALSGASAVISPSGEVSGKTELFEQAVVRAEFPAASGRTVFDVIGGWLPALFLLGLLLGLARPGRRTERGVPPLPERPRVNVVLPTYNERDTIEEVLDRLLVADDRVDVTVVDDSSPDGTGDVVRKIADGNPRVVLDERPEKGGLASAYLDGFVRAIEHGYDLIVEMDADLSHRPEDLPRLLEGAGRHHLVIGSRYVPGGEVRNWSAFRRILSRGGNLYSRFLLGIPVADATSGFRVYRWEALRELVTHQLRSEGYAFQVELAYRAWRRGMSVGEVPITFEERRHGHSKLSRTIIIEALWQVLVWAVRDRVLRRQSVESRA
jgi:apolipoprotein N-acyltransferase